MKMLIAAVLLVAALLAVILWRVQPPEHDPALERNLAEARQSLAMEHIRSDSLDDALVSQQQRARMDSITHVKTKRPLEELRRQRDSLLRELTVEPGRLSLGDSIKTTVPVAITAAIQARDSLNAAALAAEGTRGDLAELALASTRAVLGTTEKRLDSEQAKSVLLAREVSILQKQLAPPTRWQRVRSAVSVAGSAAAGAGLGALVGGPAGAVVGGAVGGLLGALGR